MALGSLHYLGAYKSALISAATLCAFGYSGIAVAQSRAATSIPNVAQASFLLDGTPNAITSNAAIVQVVELLDIGLASAGTTPPLAVSGTAAIPFTLRNLGNGQEAFLLAGSASGGSITGFAIDSDGDGQFDAAKDAMLADAATTPLAPGATQTLFALVASVPAAGAAVTIDARAATASGTPGSLAAGGGDGGVDAVVGTTSASATLRFSLAAGLAADAAQASLEKSQSVWTSGGGDAAMHGAIVTYTLTARFTRGTALDAVVGDPIPSGTRYVPGSLTLDGAALSDTADSDAGSFDGAAIRAGLGNVAAPATHVIQFKVSIQ